MLNKIKFIIYNCTFNPHYGENMSKYNIVVTSINTEAFPFKGSGTINGVTFEAQTIIYNGGPIWKTVEHGMCPAPTSMSQFSRGERSAIAAWMKKVEQQPELVEQSSQMAGAMGLVQKRQVSSQAQQVNQEMKNEIEELKAMIAMLMGTQGEDEEDSEG